MSAYVTVDGEDVGRIGRGLLVLLGVGGSDTSMDADYLVDKTIGLRVFPDEKGKMNLSLVDTGGELLVVSQFTLYGDCHRGRRPSFDDAAAPGPANELYEYFCRKAVERGVRVQTGRFAASMQVHLVNDGPVTLICESQIKGAVNPS